MKELEGNKPFFHEADESEILQLKTIGEVMDKYSQPEWCSYPDALGGTMGCWSLMDIRGLRKEISVDFCNNCECFKHRKDDNQTSNRTP